MDRLRPLVSNDLCEMIENIAISPDSFPNWFFFSWKNALIWIENICRKLTVAISRMRPDRPFVWWAAKMSVANLVNDSFRAEMEGIGAPFQSLPLRAAEFSLFKIRPSFAHHQRCLQRCRRSDTRECDGSYWQIRRWDTSWNQEENNDLLKEKYCKRFGFLFIFLVVGMVSFFNYV